MTDHRPPRERSLTTAASVALAGVSAGAAVGLGRLVVDTSLIPPVLLAVVVAHAASWGARRLGSSATLGIFVTLLAGAEAILVTRYGGLSTVGLPNGDVLAAIGTDLRDAWAVFQAEGAPAPVVDGFVVAAMAAVVAIAAAADALAFRVGAPIEAVAPASGLFLFTTALGGPDHQITATVLFLVALLGFILTHRVARRAGSEHWLGLSLIHI